jgi:hypothetical protein
MLIASTLDNELSKFLESKQLLQLDVPLKEIFNLYSKMIVDILYYVYKSFSNIKFSISCCELVHSIFIITLHNTKNTKLAMFLCDRAKTLFIEYINISREMVKKHSPNEYKDINMIDIKIYIYSKTIGPLQLSNNQATSLQQTSISKMNDLFILYKNFIYKLYKYLINNNENYKDFISEDDDYYNETYNSELDNSDLDNYELDSNEEENIHNNKFLNNKYKNDIICTILECVRNNIEDLLFTAYTVLNNIYIEELLDLKLDLYTNIYIPINKLLIQLVIINTVKKKQKSTIIYSEITSIKEKDISSYNDVFLDYKDIKKLNIYKQKLRNLK